MSELSLPDHLKDALQPLLIEAQGTSHYNSLSNADPERWTKAAALLLQGVSQKKAAALAGIDRSTAKDIQGMVLTHGDAVVFRREKAKQLATKAAAIAELEDKILGSLLDGSEESEEKIREYGPKEIQLLSVAGKVDMEAFDRVTGNTVQRVEVKNVSTPEQAIDLINNLPEVIDAEVVENND
jgi:hypothetical protein